MPTWRWPTTRFSCGLTSALKARGFVEEFSGDHRPPVRHYRFGGDTEFYAEFLTLLRGGPTRRDGRPDATQEIGGVTAHKLRHIDLLLVAPWSMRVAAGTDGGFSVRVPNATSYIVQKLVTLWTDRVAPALTPKDSKALRAVIDTPFSDVTDVTRDAALMAAGRHLSARTLVETCHAGLASIMK